MTISVSIDFPSRQVSSIDTLRTIRHMKVDLQSVFPLRTLTPVLSAEDTVVPNVQRLAQRIVSEESSSLNWRKGTAHFKLGTKKRCYQQWQTTKPHQRRQLTSSNDESRESIISFSFDRKHSLACKGHDVASLILTWLDLQKLCGLKTGTRQRMKRRRYKMTENVLDPTMGW